METKFKVQETRIQISWSEHTARIVPPPPPPPFLCCSKVFIICYSISCLNGIPVTAYPGLNDFTKYLQMPSDITSVPKDTLMCINEALKPSFDTKIHCSNHQYDMHCFINWIWPIIGLLMFVIQQIWLNCYFQLAFVIHKVSVFYSWPSNEKMIHKYSCRKVLDSVWGKTMTLQGTGNWKRSFVFSYSLVQQIMGIFSDYISLFSVALSSSNRWKIYFPC